VWVATRVPDCPRRAGSWPKGWLFGFPARSISGCSGLVHVHSIHAWISTCQLSQHSPIVRASTELPLFG
jgi:hypothetical protein